MDDKNKARYLTIGVEPNGKTRTGGPAEFVGALATSVYKVPDTVERALADRDRLFSREALDVGASAKQALSLHYLLGFYPDESEASGHGERYEILKAHEEKFGPLPYHVVYFLLRCALSGSYKKRSRKITSSGGEAKNVRYRLAEQRIIKAWKTGVYDSVPECVRVEIDALRKYKPGLEKLSVRTVEDWLRNYENTK